MENRGRRSHLLYLLYENHCILYEHDPTRHFVVPSGRTPYWIDLDSAFSNTELSGMIAELIWNEISHNSFDFLVAGVPAAGPLGIAPIAGYLSIHRKKPLVIWNEIRFGEASFTSDPTSGKKAIVIHDTVCAGKTLSRIVADVREMGVICDTAVVVVDREEEAKKNLSRQGIELRSVLTLVEIDRYRKEREHE